eukprot:TRINITY_DN4643_c0_g1_i2.p1 TRINITY_DN4643_c0_g1~~TRINITY_DN4643_c0_g1_i2.p1  ORF type:complete len:241 (-),score=55.98 TRINITY_DN4643_c0_g1_i2:146-868(-)
MSSRKEHTIEADIKLKENAGADTQIVKDFKAKYAKQNELIHKNFSLPPSEIVLDHHACAHYGTIPKQGRLYITPQHVVFYANILGKKILKTIPFEKIVEIKKDASTMLAISPIEIHLKFKRFTFVSFLNREKAYTHLMMQWQLNKEGNPFAMKIPLDDRVEEDNEDDSSLRANAAEEPMSESIEAPQPIWGVSTGAVITEEPPKAPRSFRGTLGKMPKFISSEPQKSKCASCFSCFPCFK